MLVFRFRWTTAATTIQKNKEYITRTKYNCLRFLTITNPNPNPYPIPTETHTRTTTTNQQQLQTVVLIKFYIRNCAATFQIFFSNSTMPMCLCVCRYVYVWMSVCQGIIMESWWSLVLADKTFYRNISILKKPQALCPELRLSRERGWRQPLHIITFYHFVWQLQHTHTHTHQEYISQTRRCTFRFFFYLSK